MPLYEFFCDDCEKKHEILLKLSDQLPGQCPHCGGQRFRKLVSRTAFVLQGGGWYAQGYTGVSNVEKKPESSTEKAPSDKSSTDTSKSQGSAFAGVVKPHNPS